MCSNIKYLTQVLARMTRASKEAAVSPLHFNFLENICFLYSCETEC